MALQGGGHAWESGRCLGQSGTGSWVDMRLLSVLKGHWCSRVRDQPVICLRCFSETKGPAAYQGTHMALDDGCPRVFPFLLQSLESSELSQGGRGITGR